MTLLNRDYDKPFIIIECKCTFLYIVIIVYLNQIYHIRQFTIFFHTKFTG